MRKAAVFASLVLALLIAPAAHAVELGVVIEATAKAISADEGTDWDFPGLNLGLRLQHGATALELTDSQPVGENDLWWKAGLLRRRVENTDLALTHNIKLNDSSFLLLIGGASLWTVERRGFDDSQPPDQVTKTVDLIPLIGIGVGFQVHNNIDLRLVARQFFTPDPMDYALTFSTSAVFYFR